MRVPPDAFWIGPAHPFDLHEVYLDFRRDLVLADAVREAAIFVTADSRYRLWINGEAIASGPARCWPHAQQVDVIDITSFLRQGCNAIAVQVYSPGYSHFSYVHRGACGLLAWIEANGECVIQTDATWRARRNPSWSDHVGRVSIYGSGVEVRDLALDDEWEEGTVDTEQWPPARVVAPAEGFLWRGLRLRDVPLLDETASPLGTPRFYREGRVASATADPHELLREAWASTQPAATESIASKSRLSAGDVRIWVFDLGASCICRGEAFVENTRGGETLLVSYAEKLRDGELVLSDPSTYCRMRPTDRFRLRTGAQTASTFTKRGGRYIIFCLITEAASDLAINFRVQRTHYPLTRNVPSFADPGLQGIQGMCAQTLLNCLQDGFVDSVWRESSQWLGDGVAQAFALESLGDDLRPLRRMIVMAAEGAYKDGILPSVLPGEVHAYAVTDYNFSWIELLHMYCARKNAADADTLLAEWLPTLERMLGRFAQDEDDAGLLRPQPGRRLFLDWSRVSRAQPNLTYNGRYLNALMLASEHAVRANDLVLAQHLDRRVHKLRATMRAVFRAADGWIESPGAREISQLALALVILTDTESGSAADRLADRIVTRSLDLSEKSENALAVASPFMHHYVFLALHHLGRWADIEAIIRARWGRWADAGEPTVWENWNVDFPDGSVCHGFSAHPLRWLQICAAHVKRG